QTLDLYAAWQLVPDFTMFDNGFKVQWEMFIRHVAEDTPYKYTLREGAKGLQLVEAAMQSWKERRWVDIPALPI
ncbi:MAG: Gfo/Idh/MocA family oxidoreductase, partial [Hyphomicrobiales bacterium]